MNTLVNCWHLEQPQQLLQRSKRPKFNHHPPRCPSIHSETSESPESPPSIVLMTHHHSPFAGDNYGGADDGDERQGRWLTGTEALLAQAFPVHHGIHKGFRLCCFNVPAKSEDGPLFQRVSRVMRQQAGNSMNLFAMTVQYLYLLLYVKARVLRLDLYQ